MADHRVTDLSYGHLGKASYDPEDNEWKFSADLRKEIVVQQLVPFKQWHEPSIQEIPDSKETRSDILKSQRKWLAKAHPVLCPADTLAATLSQLDFAKDGQKTPHTGSLLAIGCVVEIERESGSRKTPQILAVACGEAGEVLRLIRPQVETRGWRKESAARLSLLESESLEYGHWMGKGGAIRQIVVADSENGPSTWLAVRQDSATTIFRPQYGKLYDTSSSSNSFSERFPVSLLNPNPVITLTVEQTQSTLHADVAFNPWYARQFAVVDSAGIWSVWNIDNPHRKQLPQLLSPGKRGGIHDDYQPGPLEKPNQYRHFDGWHKVLWTCDINTIVVCNRRFLTVVDLRSGKSRLQRGLITPESSHDWILDIHRSSKDGHIFVLTTSRLFWLRITPAGAGNEDFEDLDAKVFLSYRHFRSVHDESLKLVVMQDDDISVMVTSATSPLVNYYSFKEHPDLAAVSTSSQGSFSLALGEESSKYSIPHICFIPCPLNETAYKASSGPELQYIENEVQFFQVLSLKDDLELSSSLLSIHSREIGFIGRPLSVTAPMHRGRQPRRKYGRRFVDDPFIVPDWIQEDEDVDDVDMSGTNRDMATVMLDKRGKDPRAIVFAKVYKRAFGLDSRDDEVAPRELITVPDLVSRVLDRMQSGLEDRDFSIKTLTEMAGTEVTASDLDEASQAVHQCLISLEPDPESGSSFKVIISNTQSVLGNISGSDPTHYPDMSSLYDSLSDYWMTSLPRNVPDSARVARFRILHQLAIDITLSCVAVSIENKLAKDEATVEEQEDDLESLATSLATPRRNSVFSGYSSPGPFHSQLAAVQNMDLDYRLPAPSTTPSMYSHATSASDVKEDPIITRLRQYVPSIKTQANNGPGSKLPHWSQGEDPAKYSYTEAVKASLAAESGDEGGPQHRKEDARRRRRTERFLRQKRSRAVESTARKMFTPSASQPATSTRNASRPMFTPSGSQPAGPSRSEASSQVAAGSQGDFPMTQPEMGAFGSRSGQKKKKGKTPRKAGFR